MTEFNTRSFTEFYSEEDEGFRMTTPIKCHSEPSEESLLRDLAQKTSTAHHKVIHDLRSPGEKSFGEKPGRIRTGPPIKTFGGDGLGVASFLSSVVFKGESLVTAIG
jgi:hypothetical protein